MSLIKREPSPVQSEASRANSLHSTGPRTRRGQAISSSNSLKPRLFSEVAGRSLEALGERPGDFEKARKTLSAAMRPRDAWESAWVQDIAILRWRLERLQRAEVGMLAEQKRRLRNERKRQDMPATGRAALIQRQQLAVAGFTGLSDSPWKFQQVIEYLKGLRAVVFLGDFAEDSRLYFDILFGKEPGAQGAVLRAQFEALAKQHAAGRFQEGCPQQVALTERLDQEISNYQQTQALYAAEHAENDPVQEDADLLLPQAEMDAVIRLETHLEDQIERKLRQFYARRREPALTATETKPWNQARNLRRLNVS